MSRKVYIPDRFVQYIDEYMKNNNCELKPGPQDTLQQLLDNALDCDAIVVALGPINKEFLTKATKLKVAAKLGVGVDNLDRDTAAELGIWCTNAPFSNSLSVAEFTITAICTLAKNYARMDACLRDGTWEAKLPELRGSEIEGRTLGLIGVGRIGSIVAKKAAHGLGMKVLGYDRYADPATLPPEIEMRSSLDDLLGEADYVSMHTPLTDETRLMMNEQRFRRMKPTAYFINMARGEIMDEDALYRALRDKHIAGAALDAFAVEPPDLSRDIFTLPNVHVTPHKASHTLDAQRRMAEHAAQCIVEVLDGKVPTWPVNKPAFVRPV